jgi:hypothetical protein
LDRQSPAFQAETPAAIQGQLNNLLEALNLRDVSASDSDSSGGEIHFLEVRAVAKHRNGDICLSLQSPEQVNALIETSDEWLPLFPLSFESVAQYMPSSCIVSRRPSAWGRTALSTG